MMSVPEATVRERARALQRRLNNGRVDPITAATEARRIFLDARDSVRAHWLELELEGYGSVSDSAEVHDVLGASADDRLVAHVAAYRTQQGLSDEPGGGHQPFAHFFVEPLSELVAMRAAAANSSGLASIELEFAPSTTPSTHPLSGYFGGDIFERIVGGFVAALHLQLGARAG